LGVLAAGAARRRRRAACGGFWELCAFWSLAKTAAPKCSRGNILTLLAFGPVSLRLLDLVVPEEIAKGAQ